MGPLFSRRPQPDEDDAVPRDERRERALEDADVLLTPDVPHDLLSADAEAAPLGLHLGHALTPIEQAHRLRSVLQVPDPDLQVAVLGRALARPSERVLVDVDD